ncbi:methionyl-tRNA formyltransferase [soil metagenome]
MGNDPWSVPTLELLADAADVDVGLVVTNPPRAAGRGSTFRSTAVATSALRLGLDVRDADGLGSTDDVRAIERSRSDAIVVVAYGELLDAHVLGLPRLGTLNLHFSRLPRWRGASPVQRAILEGDDVTGVSVMLLDEGLDTGPVLAFMPEPIEPEDDAGSLGERLADLGARLVLDSLRALDAGTATLEPQDPAGATYAPKLRTEDRTIDWTLTAEQIVRRVRASAPTPGATTTFRGKPLKVLCSEARPAPHDLSDHAPGEVVVDPDGVPVVATARGAVALLEVAPAGRAHMSGAEWARGARIEQGERCT